MSCPSADVLADWAAGRLEPAEAERISLHAAGCVRCRSEAAALAPTGEPPQREALSALPTAPIQGGAQDEPYPPVLGRYLVIEKLGAGGMGAVFVAYDPQLDRRVAVKILHPEMNTPDARERIAREARALAALSHPNVVTVFDVGTAGDRLFIAMEHVRGANLRQWAREQSRGVREIVEIYRQAGRGLAAVHAAGMVHRDFKPDNAFIGQDGRVRVGDFGLAQLVSASSLAAAFSQAPVRPDALTRPGAILGTPLYMPPEQLLEGTADARSDQFSFCASLYEALYGERPFDGSSIQELARRIRRGEVRPPPPGVDVPVWLRRILLRGLAGDPKERWPGMEALVAELGRDPARLRRRRIAVAGAAGLATLLAALPLESAWSRRIACASGASLAGVWDPASKQALRAGFLGGGVPYAQEMWGRVAERLDLYAADWSARYSETCSAGRSRELACLAGRKQDFASLAAFLAKGSPELVENAVDESLLLRSPASCAASTHSRTVEEASSPANIEVKQDLLRVTELRGASRLADAEALATTAVRKAEALGELPSIAEAKAALADIEVGLAKREEAERDWQESILAALRAGDDDQAARAWIRLAELVGCDSDPHRQEEGLRFVELAKALAGRVGNDPDLEILLARGEGDLARCHGRFDRASDRYQEVLRRLADEGADGLQIAEAANLLGASLYRTGRYDEAHSSYDRARQILEKKLVPGHPRVALSLNNIALVLGSEGKLEEALESFRKARAIWEASRGPDDPGVAAALNNEGGTLENLGRPTEALPLLERSLAIREKVFGPENPQVVRTLMTLGRVLQDLRRGDEAARDLRRAVSITERQDPEHLEAGILTALAELQLDQSQPREAAGTLERVLVILQRDAASAPEAAAIGLARTRASGRGSDRERARLLAHAVKEAFAHSHDALAQDLDAWFARHDESVP